MQQSTDRLWHLDGDWDRVARLESYKNTQKRGNDEAFEVSVDDHNT